MNFQNKKQSPIKSDKNIIKSISPIKKSYDPKMKSKAESKIKNTIKNENYKEWDDQGIIDYDNDFHVIEQYVQRDFEQLR